MLRYNLKFGFMENNKKKLSGKKVILKVAREDEQKDRKARKKKATLKKSPKKEKKSNVAESSQIKKIGSNGNTLWIPYAVHKDIRENSIYYRTTNNCTCIKEVAVLFNDGKESLLK